MNFTLAKQNESSMIGKQNILTQQLKGIFLQPLLNMSEPLDIISDGTIFFFFFIYFGFKETFFYPRAEAFFKCQHQQREATVIFIVN